MHLSYQKVLLPEYLLNIFNEYCESCYFLCPALDMWVFFFSTKAEFLEFFKYHLPEDASEKLVELLAWCSI